MNKVMKQTPIYAIARDAGASFVEEAGWRVVDGFGRDEVGLQAARRAVALADCSARGKVLVEGETAVGVVQKAWGVAEVEVGEGAAFPGGYVYRLRHDRYFVSVGPVAAAETVQKGEASARAAEGLVTVTDVTDGQGEVWLVGPAAREMLSRLCGLDLHPDAFPDRAARESSVAKTKQLIIRRDVGATPAFALIGDRSLAAYLWQTALEAGHDLRVAAVGQSVLTRLAKDGREGE